MPVVAVYGTLKRGGANHRYLKLAEFLGRCTIKEITLYDLGPYPGAKLEGSDGVAVEVYRVSEVVFAQLDELEDYQADAPERGEYDRIRLDTPFGRAWTYLYNPRVKPFLKIHSGCWPIAR